MKSTNVKSMVAKVMTVGLLAGAVVLAAPAKAQAQIAVGVQLGYPQYGYQQRGYYDHERQEAIARHEAWERQQAYLQHEAWERQQAYLRHEEEEREQAYRVRGRDDWGRGHEGWGRDRDDRFRDRDR
jgi:hypothetical protein